MRQRVLILGATSPIARALAREFAAAESEIILAARDVAETERIAADLRIRFGANVSAIGFDALDFDSHAQVIEQATSDFDGIFGVALCHGMLVDQPRAASDYELAKEMLDTNFTSAVSILNRVANYLEQQKRGFICGVSSVAGDRGRQSNYLYGASKAALSTFLQGLRNRLSRSNVTVLTVKPGFVDTSMTFGLPGTFLVAAPERAAADIARAIRRRRNTIYTPWFWRYIMAMIKLIPEPIFKRMKL